MSEIREIESWITRKELAVRMGVSVRTVDRLTAAGMPSTTWGSKTRRYRASQAIYWAGTVYQKTPADRVNLTLLNSEGATRERPPSWQQEGDPDAVRS